jgi:hypothetical protein
MMLKHNHTNIYLPKYLHLCIALLLYIFAGLSNQPHLHRNPTNTPTNNDERSTTGT